LIKRSLGPGGSQLSIFLVTGEFVFLANAAGARMYISINGDFIRKVVPWQLVRIFLTAVFNVEL
jgi:hypothetical protein